MKALVTGATGFFGGNLLRELCARGVEVRYLSRNGRPAAAAAGTSAVCVAGDVTQPASLADACAGVDWVFHAAALVSFEERDRPAMERVNVEGTRALLAACAHVKRFVLVSSIDTMFDFAALGVTNPYPDTKIAQEKLVLASALDTVVVNPGFMIGPWDPKPSSSRMVLEIMKGRGVLAPSGGNSFVDVMDVVRGTLLALERGVKGKRYPLAGHNLKYKDFWSRVAQVCGKRPPVGVVPQWLVNAVAPVSFGLVKPGEARFASIDHYFDSGPSVAELGYTISPIEPAIARARDWFIAHKYAK